MKSKNKDNRVVINFDTKFFSKEAILQTAHEYTESFWVLVDGSEDSTIVILIPKEGEAPDILEDEFYNYALATMKNTQFI